MVRIHHEILLTDKKGGYSAVCNNLDGPRARYGMQVRERRVLYDTIYVWNLKKLNLFKKKKVNDGYQGMMEGVTLVVIRVQTWNK